MDTYFQDLGFYQERFESGLGLENVIENGELIRAEFIRRNLSPIGPPKEFRVIDCKSTKEGKKVVLRDWRDVPSTASGGGIYTAVSHTFGMNIYSVFDCECTSTCFAKVPRCSSDPCPAWHDPAHWNAVGDVLKMCDILMAAGAEYVWHDGVCIAQHDSAEVSNTIKHMGWIYANAKDTVIFLHYVGSPMAPIRQDPHPVTGDLGSRWHTRVWTLQEASVSTRRRYCVRVGGSDLRHCNSLQEFQDEIANWYKDESSTMVIEEWEYWKLLLNLHSALGSLLQDAFLQDDDDELLHYLTTIAQWMKCLTGCIDTLLTTCFSFPTADRFLAAVSERDSKHEGDRINSILALAQVRDFVVPKDPDNMETWTIEFFKRQGQQGLAVAVFSVNYGWDALIRDTGIFTEPCSSAASCSSVTQPQAAGRRHSWVPSLSTPMEVSTIGTFVDSVSAIRITDLIQFKVLSDGRIELRGNLESVAVQFTHRSPHDVVDADEQEVQELLQHRRKQKGVQQVAMDLRYVNGNFKAFAEGGSSSAGEEEWGRVVLPYKQTEMERFPVIEGNEIQNGGNFGAYLVFAEAGLRLHEDGSYVNCNPDGIRDYWSVPALLVRGQLQSQVVKLGFFLVYPQLRGYLEERPSLLTLLHKLVIV